MNMNTLTEHELTGVNGGEIQPLNGETLTSLSFASLDWFLRMLGQPHPPTQAVD